MAGEAPAAVVHDDERTIAFLDINPATLGHLLVVPRTHVPDIHGITDDDLVAVAQVARLLAGRVVDRLRADGVNIVQANGAAAWQTVFHFHVHVVPRYAGDPLRLPWTPRPADRDELAALAQGLR